MRPPGLCEMIKEAILIISRLVESGWPIIFAVQCLRMAYRMPILVGVVLLANIDRVGIVE